MTLSWKQWLGIGAAMAASTQIGTGLKAVSWLVGVPEIAYAARAKAEDVDEKFQAYLSQQDATARAQQAAADAVNAYIQQQTKQTPAQSGPSSPRVYRGLTKEGQEYCYDEQGWWWPDAQGAC